MPEPQKLGKYEIRRQLGRGAMGIVYEGYDPFIQRIVALKTVRKKLLDQDQAQEMLARFQREAQAAGRLNHPNIVAIHDYGEDQDIAYIAMEFVEGRELKELFSQNARLELTDVVNIMSQLLSALDYSHQNGVVHRDIKPANIIVMANGRVKIADFGIARLESSNLTQTGSVLGTPNYMSPEQFMGQHVDGRSDLFSAGVVLYQLLTGEKPFVGESTTTIMYQVLHNTPNAPSELNVQVPVAFDGVARKALAKRPDDRFQTGQEFLDALLMAAEGKPFVSDVESTIVARKLPVDSAGATQNPARTSARTNKKTLIGAGAALAASVLAGIALLATSHKAETLPAGQPQPATVAEEKTAAAASDKPQTTKSASQDNDAKTAPKKPSSKKSDSPAKQDARHESSPSSPKSQPKDKPAEKKKGLFGEELKPSPWRKEGDFF